MSEHWQAELKTAVTTLDTLLHALDLKHTQVKVTPTQLQFPIRVPHPFLKRIKKGHAEDPLLLQVLPQHAEASSPPHFIADPLNEKANLNSQSLLHKYHGRVLLITTSGCAIHCRYCFRQHFPYQGNTFSLQHSFNTLEYIKNDPSIFEVILSGGDPLILKDQQLMSLIAALEKIPHLHYLRIHTRFPIMIPSRITPTLSALLSNTRLKTTLVIHCNHPQEIDEHVANALTALNSHNVTLLNQSVLLKKINDQASTLINLSHRLHQVGVLPYYLHLLDRVQGAAHFEVPDQLAKQLIKTMRASLPGYLVPRLVREEPGKPAKTIIS